jgi:hypothetical protein
VVPNVFSIWAVVPLASTYRPEGRVLPTWKPCDESQPRTAETSDALGEYFALNCESDSQLP